MPTFFEGLKRLLVGQPVFKEGEGVDGVEHKADARDAALEQPPVVDAVGRPGPKVIPEVIIERIEYRNDGDDMDVDAEIKNQSDRDVFVDQITILGQTRQIDRVLRPGEQREIPVYSGRRPNHRNYSNCDLKYRDETTGDYFSSGHFVEFEQEQDKTYVVKRIRFVPPVRDI